MLFLAQLVTSIFQESTFHRQMMVTKIREVTPRACEWIKLMH